MTENNNNETTQNETTQHETENALQFQYDGKMHAITRKVAKYVFLNIITFGIYRFWTKTHLRRYFWSSVQLNNDPFAYHGTGKELFFGFLAIFAILIGFYVIDYLIQLWLTGNTLIFIIYITTIAVIFTFLFHFAIFRMVNYRLTRTSWRGIRFALDGKPLKYATKALALYILNIITIGIAWPRIRSHLLNYRINRARFGNKHFNSTLSAKHLRSYYILLANAYIVIAGIAIIATQIITKALKTGIDISNENNIEDLLEDFVNNNTPQVAFVIIVAALLPFVSRYYRFAEIKAILSHIQIGNIQFTCRIAPLKTAIFFILLFIAYYIGFAIVAFGSVLFIGFISEVFQFLGGVLKLIIILSLSAMAAYSVYFYFYFFSIALLNWAFARIIAQTELTGDTAILNDIDALRAQEPTRGEGWFEALDIGNT